jgi:N-terminal domain of galactosyltransferase
MIAVVPFRAGEPGRVEGARHVVAALRGLGARVVVVEHDTPHVELGADAYLELGERGLFNRSACFNAGARAFPPRGGADPILFSDGDVLCPPEALRAATAALGAYDVVSPYHELFDLSEDETARVYRGEVPAGGVRRDGINLTGGAVVMSRAAFDALGGWDARMVGWGGEDDLLSHVIVKLGLRFTFLPFTAHHLWHGRGAWSAEAGAQYQRNLARLDRVFRMSPDELRRDVEARRAEVARARWPGIRGDEDAPRAFGDDTTYARARDFLRDLDVEDWGCGLGWFRRHATGAYRGVDAVATRFADVITDLRRYRSRSPGLLVRHVLEHNDDWRPILRNALASFTRRMTLVIFTPPAPRTHVLRRVEHAPGLVLPEIAFARTDLAGELGPLLVGEEIIATDTQYGVEHVFYLER